MERINEGFNMNKFKKKARNVFKKVKANVPSSKNTRSGGKYKWVKDKDIPSFNEWEKDIKKDKKQKEKDKLKKEFEKEKDILIQNELSGKMSEFTIQQTEAQTRAEAAETALVSCGACNDFLLNSVSSLKNIAGIAIERTNTAVDYGGKVTDLAEGSLRQYEAAKGIKLAKPIVDPTNLKLQNFKSQFYDINESSNLDISKINATYNNANHQYNIYKKAEEKAIEARRAAKKAAEEAAAAAKKAANKKTIGSIASSAFKAIKKFKKPKNPFRKKKKGFKGQREGAEFRGCDRKSNFGYNCIADYRGPNKRWDNSNNIWNEDEPLNANDYNIYDKYINTFNDTNKNIEYSLANQFMNRCNAITDYSEIRTWAEALLDNNNDLHNKRIDISTNSVDSTYNYTIDFYREYGSNNGSFAFVNKEISGNYVIDFNNTANLTGTGIDSSITINDDGTIDFSYNDISFNNTDDYKITHLYDVNDIKYNDRSWNVSCINTQNSTTSYNDDFNIQSSGLISNRNSEVLDGAGINTSTGKNSYIKKFYSNNELESKLNDEDILNNLRDSSNNHIYQFNTGLRKSIGENYEEVYGNNEGEIPAIFLSPQYFSPSSSNYNYVGFGDYDELQSINESGYEHDLYKIMDSSINTLCSGYSAIGTGDEDIIKDNSAVCLIDYMNVHLEQYQRYLCDKLPYNINYIQQENVNTCKNLRNGLWSWTPNKEYTKNKNISYNDFDTWNKLETQKDKSTQNKYDTKEPYFNKRTKIILLIIGILLLLYLVKKY
tara:strand:- start:135 stop:2453 length:2319 start_codon:yes stop_codon:yes gene_type:complete